MINFISIFSIALVLTGASLTVLVAKKSLNSELKSCITSTIDLNLKRRKTLRLLFSLNKTAKILRLKRTFAERAYLLAPPHGKAPAYKALQVVKFSQKNFHAYQKKILLDLNTHNYRFIFKVLKQRARILKKPKINLVTSYPEKSDSPSYKVSNHFSDKSKVFIRKRFVLNKNFPIFFKRLLKNDKGFIECGSNMIFSRNKKMHLKLLGGKSF